MLSIEGPSGPSNSCKVSALIREERSLGSEQADPSSGFGLNQFPQFSIRDYVSSVRNENIRKNWPFPRQHLQLCLKHGIHVPLPPFEHPNSLRSRCCTYREGSEKLPNCVGRDTSGIEPYNLIEKEAVCLSDAEPKSLEHDNHLTSYPLAPDSAPRVDKINLGKAKQNTAFNEICNDAGELKSGESVIESVVTSLAHIEQSDTKQSGKHSPWANEKVLKTSSKLEVSKPSLLGNIKNAKESSGKRFKLIVKLGANPELGHVDEVSSNSSMISESMASKVCPVCKAFSSTSNTTLNAHIDQCLSKKCSVDQVIDVLSLNKVKPTKKRLMVDIYKTAIPCTLEDLDKRNGTTWALDLASLAVAGEICVDNKRHKVASMDEADGGSGKGAVFVDSDGTKVCILSKLNAMAPPILAEPSSSRMKSSVKEVKQRMGFTMGRGRLLTPKPKHMNVAKSTKREGHLALLRDRIQEESNIRPVHDVLEVHPSSEMASFQNQIRSKSPGTFKHSFSSKESAVAKKRNGAVASGADEKPSGMRSAIIRSCDSHPTRSAALKCIELSGPIESTSMARIKSTDMLSNSPASGDCRKSQSTAVDNESRHLTGEFSSNGNLSLKHPKDTKKLFRFPRRKKLKKTSRINVKSAKFPNPETDASEGSHCPTTEDRRTKVGALIKKSLLPSSKLTNHHKKKLILKRLKKQISTKRTCSEMELSPHFNECLAREKSGPMSVNDVDDPEGSRRSKTNVIIKSHLPDQNIFASEIKLPGTFTQKDGNDRFQERFNSEGEHCNHEAVDIEMQTEHSVDSAGVTKLAFDGDHPVSGEHLASEGLLVVSDSSLKSWARLVENDSFVSGREVWADTHDQRLFDNQMLHGNGLSNENTGSGNAMLGDGAFRDVADACKKSYYMDCQTKSQQVLGSSTCQSSSANTGNDVPQGNSSMTSIRVSNNDHNVVADREPCGSPISGTSNVSHPSAEELKDQTSGAVLGERRDADESGGRSKFADAWEPESFTKKRYNGECNQEVVRTPMDWHHASFWGNQPCCCSRREAVGMESLLSKHYTVPEMTLPANMRHMVSNRGLTGKMVISPFGSCSRSRIETAAHEAVESSPDYALQRTHLSRVESSTPCGHVGPSCETEGHTVPNPVLRLMGKDVLVINKDKEHSQLQNTASCPSGCPSCSAQYSSFLTHQQSMEGWKVAHSIPVRPATSLNCVPLTGMPLYGSLDTGDPTRPLQNRQAWFGNMEKAHPPYENPKPTQIPNPTAEVIVIEDSEAEAEPENELPSPASTLSSPVPVPNFHQVRQPTYFDSQYPLQMRGFPGRLRPGFQDINASGIEHTSEGRDHHNPNPAFHSRPVLFYFPS